MFKEICAHETRMKMKNLIVISNSELLKDQCFLLDAKLLIMFDVKMLIISNDG